MIKLYLLLLLVIIVLVQAEKYETFEPCAKKYLSEYSYEKMFDLLNKYTNNKILNEHGFMLSFALVTEDVSRGEDGWTREKIQASPVIVTKLEINRIWICLQSESQDDAELNSKINNIIEHNLKNNDIL